MKKDPNKRTPEQHAFYHTMAWRNCRNAYMSQVGGLCEQCKKRGLIVPAKFVHHKIELSATTINDPDIALNYDNLEALCINCHAQAHAPHPRRYRINADGSVDPIDVNKYEI